MSHRINAIGDVCLDILVNGRNLSLNGESDIPADFTTAIGGCTSNTSIVLRKLGGQVRLFSTVGDDAFGAQLTDMHPLGSDLIRNKGKTGVAMCFIDGDNRSFIHDMGVIKALDITMFDLDVLLDADAIYVGGYDHIPLMDARNLFSKAKEKDVLVFFDPGQTRIVSAELAHVDFLLVNKDEFQTLKTRGDLDDFKGKIILKQGAEGSAVLDSKDGPGHLVETESEVTVVDSTGAGDAFNAAFMHRYLKTKDELESARYANRVGRACVQSLGATGFDIDKIDEDSTDKVMR